MSGWTKSVVRRAIHGALAAVALSCLLATVAGASPVAVAVPGDRTVVTVARDDEIALARLKPDGSIDRSYGTRGYASTGIPRPFTATGIAAASDGTVTVAATHRPGLHVRFSNVVARVTADGERDESFGSNGVAQPRVGAGALYDVGNLALDANGNALVAATLYTDCAPAVSFACSEYPAVVRLTADGTVDPAFGEAGIAIVKAQGRGDALAVGPSDEIVVGSDQDIRTPVVGRFDASGEPDLAFGSGSGFAEVAVPASAAHIDADGRIYVGGADGRTLGAARLLPNGEPDTSFGTGGSYSVRLPARAVAYNGSLAVTAGGDVMAATAVGADCRRDGGSACRLFEQIVRLGANGIPDRSFGHAGIARFAFSRYRPLIGFIEPGYFVEGSGGARLVMPTFLGPHRSQPFSTASPQASTVGAVDTNGSLDRSFGKSGLAQLPFGWCPSHFCPRVSLRSRPGGRLALSVTQPRLRLTGVRLNLPRGVDLAAARVRATTGSESIEASAIKVSKHAVRLRLDRHRVQIVRLRIGGLANSRDSDKRLTANLQVMHLPGVEPYSTRVTATAK
jgi:uncharacterized delta-60 repeat protein